jgi:SAM-dependent methyltransferase
MLDRDASPGRSLLDAPAVQALLIQVLSLTLVFAIASFAEWAAGIRMTLGMAVLLQGTLAAALSYWRKLARWWLPIQLFFPVATILLLALHLPPWVFLAAFLLLLGMYWTTFRTQVPFYPSNLTIWAAIAKRLPESVRFIDIGSGFGGLALHLEAQFPRGRFSGIEVAPLPWLASRARAWARRSKVRFMRGDYGGIDLSDYDVVFAFLSPAAMPALWRKAVAEMRPGTLLLSYEFLVPGATPHIVDHPVENGPALYGWYL